MAFLISGLLIFFGIHLLPVFPEIRSRLVQKTGEKSYKGLFGLIALAGLVLIVVGMGGRAYIPVWEPPVVLAHFSLLLMVPVFILLSAAYVPCNIKRFTRHPMLWGVTFWAVAHLLANGDLGSIMLFGSFLLYSLFDMWSANRRGAEKSAKVQPLLYDAGVALLGIVGYVFFFLMHSHIIGVSVLVM